MPRRSGRISDDVIAPPAVWAYSTNGSLPAEAERYSVCGAVLPGRRDVLRLEVGHEPFVRALAAESALFDAAERG